MNLTWFGHSAFLLDDGSHTVLIDPFLTGNPANTVDPRSLSPDTILLTHAHNDHVGDTIAIAKRANSRVITTFELGEWLLQPVSYTHLRAHETVLDLVCRLLLEKKNKHH